MLRLVSLHNSIKIRCDFSEIRIIFFVHIFYQVLTRGYYPNDIGVLSCLVLIAVLMTPL